MDPIKLVGTSIIYSLMGTNGPTDFVHFVPDPATVARRVASAVKVSVSGFSNMADVRRNLDLRWFKQQSGELNKHENDLTGTQILSRLLVEFTQDQVWEINNQNDDTMGCDGIETHKHGIDEGDVHLPSASQPTLLIFGATTSNFGRFSEPIVVENRKLFLNF